MGKAVVSIGVSFILPVPVFPVELFQINVVPGVLLVNVSINGLPLTTGAGVNVLFIVGKGSTITSTLASVLQPLAVMV